MGGWSLRRVGPQQRPAASFLTSEAAETRMGRDCCEAGGSDWVKVLGTETCGVSYSQRDGRGKRLILETSYFNQMHSRWGTSCTVSFLAFHT